MTGNLARLISLRRVPPGLAASRETAPRGVRWLLFAWALACFVALLFPSEKAFAQAQTELEQIIKPPKIDQAAPMLLQADEMIYDNENARITAKGNVEIYYGNYTLLADSVVYDRGNNTLTAVGNVRIKDPDGAVITSDHITLTDDFRDASRRSPPRARLATSRCSRTPCSRLARSARRTRPDRRLGAFAPRRSRTSAIKPLSPTTTRSSISSACR
jgi:lipopolysaccharide export system protein LptA